MADQPAVAHTVNYCGELSCRQMVDAAELLRRHVHAEGVENVRLETADAISHQSGDVAVTPVLAQQGSRGRAVSQRHQGPASQAARRTSVVPRQGHWSP